MGQEWRVLHPFEIPGVKFPTDATPPNQTIAVLSRLRRGRISERTRIESHHDSGTTTSHRREYPGDDSDDSHLNRRSDRDCRPPERRRSQGHNGRPPERGHHLN